MNYRLCSDRDSNNPLCLDERDDSWAMVFSQSKHSVIQTKGDRVGAVLYRHKSLNKLDHATEWGAAEMERRSLNRLHGYKKKDWMIEV